MGVNGHRSKLSGRRNECAVLDRLLEGVRAQHPGALVLHGEPGVGKTALLEYALERASGCRVARVSGVESEMELPFAGLHQLCRGMLDGLDALPAPQRDALGAAFGTSPGPAPDRFLVGLAALGLLSEAAAAQPLVCAIDDAHWLDRESAQVLAFVARRLGADSVAMLFAVPAPPREFARLPELHVRGLAPADARALLLSALGGPLDERVLDRVVAETRGNPLALLELPRGLTAAEIAGGFGTPITAPLTTRIEESFMRRFEPLDDATKQLLLVAAAEPLGEPVLLWRAAARLGLGVEASAPAEASGLLTLGPRVRFRHPLVRSAVYRAAPPEDRRRAHAALAEATDPEVDPDRRAWHRAYAAGELDEDVAQELECSAGRARERGGVAAAAALLEYSATLTPDPARRAGRALAAADAKFHAGAVDAALGLLATIVAGPLDELQEARVDRLHAQIAFVLRRGNDAPPLLLRAARRLAPLDVQMARETFLEAIEAATYAGRLGSGRGLREAAWAGRSAPRAPVPARPVDIMLDGYAALHSEGHVAAVPLLKRALAAIRREGESEDRWLVLGWRAAAELWDGDTWQELAGRQVRLAREAGGLTALTPALVFLAFAKIAHSGDFAAAATLIAEARELASAGQSPEMAYAPLALAAWRGDEAETDALIEHTLHEATARGEGRAITLAEYAGAVLNNGLGRYDMALEAARRVCEVDEVMFTVYALPELVEAAVRAGEPAAAAAAAARLSARARLSGTDWALGMDARSRALMAEGEAADALYRDAIERLERGGAAMHMARAQLIYGEWLRAEGRRPEAREQLRQAHARCTLAGAAGFAARAAAELQASGEPARRAVTTSAALTSQEERIGRLARDGHSNADIGSQLFISPRTVEYHLAKVFTKLQIASRRELRQALAD
jgi:DNA-binding CsgD family transcriptional regulator